MNVHIFRVTTEDRQGAVCDMGNPFTCEPLENQSEEIGGRKFYVHGRDTNGNVANIPDTFDLDLTAAVPAEGVHAWDFENVLDDANDITSWNKPILVVGLYDGKFLFLCI